jgi:hypothetical protein
LYGVENEAERRNNATPLLEKESHKSIPQSFKDRFLLSELKRERGREKKEQHLLYLVMTLVTSISHIIGRLEIKEEYFPPNLTRLTYRP